MQRLSKISKKHQLHLPTYTHRYIKNNHQKRKNILKIIENKKNKKMKKIENKKEYEKNRKKIKKNEFT